MNDTISIIVAVYNVEKYIDRCIKSILNQTYRNIEILLIDDGSSDASGRICDQYKDSDDRIVVIHKKNGGLVSARKAGLNIARGEYIGFIDGDDWVEKDLYEKLIIRIKNTDSDFVESGLFFEDSNLTEEKYKCYNDTIELSDEKRRFIVESWLTDYKNAVIRNTLVTKLFKKEQIINSYTCIPENYSLGEDAIAFLYFLKDCSRVSILPYAGYHYVYRQESLSRKVSQSHINNIYKFLGKIIDIIETYYPTIDEKVFDNWIYGYSSYINRLNGELHGSIKCGYTIFDIEKYYDKNIILYGAGRVGIEIYKELCCYSGCDIVGWVDKNFDIIDNPYYKITPVESIINMDYDYIIITVLDEQTAYQIKDELLIRGINPLKIVCNKIKKILY